MVRYSNTVLIMIDCYKYYSVAHPLNKGVYLSFNGTVCADKSVIQIEDVLLNRNYWVLVVAYSAASSVDSQL